MTTDDNPQTTMKAQPKRWHNYAIVAFAFFFYVEDSSPSHPQPQHDIVRAEGPLYVRFRFSPNFVAFVGTTRGCRRSGRFIVTNIRRHRTGSQLFSQGESGTSDSWGTNAEIIVERDEREFFISDAQFVHLGPAARILTEEFYSQKTNFITFQIERLKTVLSLESTYPNKQPAIQTSYSKPSKSLQKMTVACDAANGKVVGFVEVDACSFRGSAENIDVVEEREAEATAASLQYLAANNEAPSNGKILCSYMYNLAVDKKWKRKGIASCLVRACEQFVMDAHSDSCMESRLYLRVRKCNHAAIALYESLGYREIDPGEIQLSVEDVNRGSLEDGELILFVKDLPLENECTA